MNKMPVSFEPSIKIAIEKLNNFSLAIQNLEMPVSFSLAIQNLEKVLTDTIKNYTNIFCSISQELQETLKSYEDFENDKKNKIIRRKKRHYYMLHGKHNLKRPK